MTARKFLYLAAILLFVAPLGLASAQSPATVPSSAPMKGGGDVMPPVLIHSAKLKVPRSLRAVKTVVDVSVGLTIDRAGKPANLRIVKSSDPDFDKISMDTVAKYRFKPATLHGQPVPVQMVIEVNLQVK